MRSTLYGHAHVRCAVLTYRAIDAAIISCRICPSVFFGCAQANPTARPDAMAKIETSVRNAVDRSPCYMRV